MANAIVTQRDTQLERQRAGYIQLSLTNFTTDDEPTIAAGSVVEISGTLYSVTGNESITGWAGISNGPAWIKLVPDGTDPFTAEYTDVAPTWLDAKQGWYEGTGTDRYVAGLTKTGASGYEDKFNMTAVERGAFYPQGIFPFSRRDMITTTGSWVVPQGVNLIRVIVTGGGGAGGTVSANGGDGADTQLYQGASFAVALRRVVARGGQGGSLGSGSYGGISGLSDASDKATGDVYHNQLSAGYGCPSTATTSGRQAQGGDSYWGAGILPASSSNPRPYGAGSWGLTTGGAGGGAGMTIEAAFHVNISEVWQIVIGSGGTVSGNFPGGPGVVAIYY